MNFLGKNSFKGEKKEMKVINSSPQVMEEFYSDRFPALKLQTNEDIMMKIEEDVSKDIEHDIIRGKYQEHPQGERHKTTTIGIPGIDGLDVPIEANYTIYQGSGAADDPSAVNFINILVDDDVHLSEIEIPTPEERETIGLVYKAVRKISPATPRDILIPHGLDILELNSALDGLLEENIQNLEEELYKYR